MPEELERFDDNQVFEQRPAQRMREHVRLALNAEKMAREPGVEKKSSLGDLFCKLQVQVAICRLVMSQEPPALWR